MGGYPMGYPLVYVDRTGVFTGTAGVAWHCGGTPWPQPNSLQVAGASKTPHVNHATPGTPCTTPGHRGLRGSYVGSLMPPELAASLIGDMGCHYSATQHPQWP